MAQKPAATLRNFLLSLGVWVAGVFAAADLADAHSAGLRALAVAVAVASALPWGVLVIVGIRQADEFARQVHMLAIGIGFGGVALSSIVVDWMQRAHFMGPVEFGGFAALIVWLWWGVGMIAASRYYR